MIYAALKEYFRGQFKNIVKSFLFAQTGYDKWTN